MVGDLFGEHLHYESLLQRKELSVMKIALDEKDYCIAVLLFIVALCCRMKEMIGFNISVE